MRQDKEHKIQAEFYSLLKFYMKDFPFLDLFYAVPNGGYRSKTEGAKLKREGARAGVCDMAFPYPNGTYASLYIEFKTDTGVVSSKQKEYMELLRKAHNKAVVCRSAEEALSIVADYTVDGWGTLKIPAGDFQTLRVRENYSDIIEIYVDNTLISSESTQSFSYTWTGKEALVLMRIASTEGETDPDFTTAGEVWLVSDLNSSAVSEPNISAAPLTYELQQNYPNPFNPETQIEYSLARNSTVTLTIYDVTGKTVETLVSGEQSAGKHQINWRPAGNIASGAYFYRLQTNEFVATKKMILMR